MDHAVTKIEAADSDDKIKPVSFSEAVSFLKGSVPLTKEEWNSLEPKLQFRAFTVSRLSECAYIEAAKGLLVDAIEKGSGLEETWKNVQEWAKADGAKHFLPGYWENVYRTNCETAYTAGKLMQYEKTKPVAYQLFVIEDSRTSRICRHLLTESGYGLVLPVDHPFWKKYGFPPYHFQCRTSFRAIYASQVGKDGINVDNPSMKSLSKFKPLEGFGGNPVDNGNWYMMLPSQVEQAIKFGILNEFNREENIIADFDSLWKGYERHENKDGNWYDLCDNPPSDWETNNKSVVQFLVKNGYNIKVIPEMQNIKKNYNVEWSNPDIIIDGKLADIKIVEKSIKSRLRSARDQELTNVVLTIPESFSEQNIRDAFSKWKGGHHTKMNVIWIYKKIIHEAVL